MGGDAVRSDLRSIPGWLQPDDEALLRFVLGEQARRGVTGDLAELGVYMGRSAVLIGDYLQPGETFTVVDLFEDPADDTANGLENANWYEDLTEQAFRAQYRRFHPQLPLIVRGPTSGVLDHAAHGTHRLVHVDASHLYDHVRTDVDSARTLLRDDGIVVFDDYRSQHTPGTSAAVWEAVGRTGLVPLVVSEVKFYGTWGDPADWQDRFARWLPTSPLASELQAIAGHPVQRVWVGRVAPGRRFADAVTPPALRRLAGIVARRARQHA